MKTQNKIIALTAITLLLVTSIPISFASCGTECELVPGAYCWEDIGNNQREYFTVYECCWGCSWYSAWMYDCWYEQGESIGIFYIR